MHYSVFVEVKVGDRNLLINIRNVVCIERTHKGSVNVALVNGESIHLENTEGAKFIGKVESLGLVPI